ncbi:MAG: hypothetical protein MK089_12950, partial [Phycisphaerales bacterium]|nr:hypothetical protein [Phycisphaerales bacterium]
MALLIAAFLTLLNASEIPVGPARLTMPDLVRSWSWVDQSLAAKEMNLEERRTMSRRLDDMTMLFFRNDIGGVGRAMDDLSLGMMLGDDVTDAHRVAAALLLKLSDQEDGPALKARWRYQPPSPSDPIAMTLVLDQRNGSSHDVELVVSPGPDGWSIQFDESDLASL